MRALLLVALVAMATVTSPVETAPLKLPAIDVDLRACPPATRERMQAYGAYLALVGSPDAQVKQLFLIALTPSKKDACSLRAKLDALLMYYHATKEAKAKGLLLSTALERRVKRLARELGIPLEEK